jgi:hypothetical protein
MKALPRPFLSLAVLGRARRRFPFLVEHHFEDVGQVAALVKLLDGGGIEESRNADRELYRLARDLGYRRPAAGLRRGTTGRWARTEVLVEEDEA